MKRFTQFLLATMMLVLAFGMTSEAAGKKLKITAPTTKKTYTVYRTNKNVSKTIKVNVGNKNVTFTSNKPEVVSVNKKGKFTAKKAGTATITVKTKTKPVKKATLKIKVVQRATKLTATTEGYTIKKNISVTKGKSINVKVTASPEGAKNKVTWKTSNKKVATVKNGKITAKKTGKAKITATAKDGSKKKVTFTVKVVAGKVTSVSVDKTAVALVVGGSAAEAETTVAATVKTTGKNANKTVVWSSSDEKVATVKDGKITAVAPGTATITVKAIDGTKKSATVAVTVTKKVVETPATPSTPSQPTPSTPSQPTEKPSQVALTAKTSALTNGFTVAASKAIKWDDPAKALAALNKATADNADIVPSKVKNGVNVIANGKAYTLKYDGTTYSLTNANGDDIILSLLNGSAGDVVISNTATDAEVKTYLRKVYAGKHLLVGPYDFGTGKVTVDGKEFVISKFVLNNGDIEAVVNGAEIKAVMTNPTTVIVDSTGSLDDAVAVVEAMLGGAFTAE